MKFPLLRVSAAPFFRAGARLLLLLPPSLVPRDAMPGQDGGLGRGDGRHKEHRPCTEQALGILLPPYPADPAAAMQEMRDAPNHSPSSLLFPPAPSRGPYLHPGTLGTPRRPPRRLQPGGQTAAPKLGAALEQSGSMPGQPAGGPCSRPPGQGSSTVTPCLRQKAAPTPRPPQHPVVP